MVSGGSGCPHPPTDNLHCEMTDHLPRSQAGAGTSGKRKAAPPVRRSCLVKWRTRYTAAPSPSGRRCLVGERERIDLYGFDNVSSAAKVSLAGDRNAMSGLITARLTRGASDRRTVRFHEKANLHVIKHERSTFERPIAVPMRRGADYGASWLTARHAIISAVRKIRTRRRSSVCAGISRASLRTTLTVHFGQMKTPTLAGRGSARRSGSHRPTHR